MNALFAPEDAPCSVPFDVAAVRAGPPALVQPQIKKQWIAESEDDR